MLETLIFVCALMAVVSLLDITFNGTSKGFHE